MSTISSSYKLLDYYRNCHLIDKPCVCFMISKKKTLDPKFLSMASTVETMKNSRFLMNIDGLFTCKTEVFVIENRVLIK
jgi:hypothetical protein